MNTNKTKQGPRVTKLEHALKLAELGFWVFPIVNGKKKPMHKGWQELATRKEKAIRYWFGGGDCNIGIYTGKFGDGEALLVVDVDNKGEKRGDSELLRLELEGFDLPETYTHRTPSGGRHLVYRVERPVKQGANVLGHGLDIRSRGGYIVGAGSRTDQGEYTAEIREVLSAPVWLVERCGRGRDRDERREPALQSDISVERAVERAKHYLLNEAPLAIEGQGGDETTYKVAARVKDLGVNLGDCIVLLWNHWNQRCSPPWSEEDLLQKVKNAYAYGTEPVGTAAPEADFPPIEESKHSAAPNEAPAAQHPYDKLNDEYAFVLAGGGAHVLWETTDQNGKYKLEHLALGAFNAKFANRKMVVGKKAQPLSNLWLEWKGRREYDGLVFMPEQKAPARFYNLWRGFAVEPADKVEQNDALDAFLAHARDNVCRGDGILFRWLIGYVAHLVQRPWEKPLVALVFRGGKGVGKNAFIERVGALLGGHFLLTSNRRYLIGNFNGHLENCLLFALDEAFWSGDKQAEGTLKDLITGRDHVIEHKGKEPYTVANKTRVCIIGNEDWLVPASHDERRFAVFDVGDGRKQDRNFFQRMREGMEAGAYRVLLKYLLDYDLKGIDLNEAPSTKALLEQKHHTLDPLQQYWLDCLEEGRIIGAEFTEWPKDIECERFRSAFRRYVRERNIRSRIPEDRAIGRLLKQCAPGVTKGRVRRGEDLPYVYHVPSLEVARGEWAKFIGHKVEWAE